MPIKTTFLNVAFTLQRHSMLQIPFLRARGGGGCFVFNLEQVGGILAPGNTPVWGAVKPIGIAAEEDKVFTISNDWKLIKEGWRERCYLPSWNISRFISGSDSAWAGGRGSRAINYNASCPPQKLRDAPRLVGLSIRSGVDEQSNLSGMSCRFKLFLKEEFISKITEARDGASRPVPAPSGCVSLPGHWPLGASVYSSGKKGFPSGSAGKASTCNAGDTGDSGLIPGSGRSPGEGSGNPLQYSCQKNPMGREAWWATVQRAQRVRHDWPLSTQAQKEEAILPDVPSSLGCLKVF